MAQYEELNGRINELSAKIDSLTGGKLIETIEDAKPFYDQAISELQEAGYINGTGDGLDFTEDMARVVTIFYRVLKAKGVL